MCGIAGICLLRESGSVSVETLSRMTGILRHRGPDESGIYVDDRVGLGHARLSIIDLSGGVQPIPNEDETMWIVFNGEIFNYPELRETLVSRGHRFRTSTDTEVIVHLYEEKGPACLEELNGQFALAIWDSKSGSSSWRGTARGFAPCIISLRGIGSSFPRRSNRSFRTGRSREGSPRKGSIRSSPSGRRYPGRPCSMESASCPRVTSCKSGMAIFISGGSGISLSNARRINWIGRSGKSSIPHRSCCWTPRASGFARTFPSGAT